ncbi:MAG: hypothetical protein JWR21_3990 [Herminiimonas sp.]|nr:hypothetical protein [Herminiimonas sp.]
MECLKPYIYIYFTYITDIGSAKGVLYTFFLRALLVRSRQVGSRFWCQKKKNREHESLAPVIFWPFVINRYAGQA